MIRYNLIAGGGGARLAAHAGAFRAVRALGEPQRIVTVSVGAASGGLLATGVEQRRLESLVHELDMEALIGLPKGTRRRVWCTAANLWHKHALRSLEQPIEAFATMLASLNVQRFGDLPPLDPEHATTLHSLDAYRLNVRVWSLPERFDNAHPWALATLARIAADEKKYGEGTQINGEADAAGVFRSMRTLQLPADGAAALVRDGYTPHDAQQCVAQLPIAPLLGMTMALPVLFPVDTPRSIRSLFCGTQAIPAATCDGAMLQRIPTRRFPILNGCEEGTNDLFRLRDGRPERLPVIAIAMEQPNGLSPTEQHAWDLAHKTRRRGIWVIRLPNLGIKMYEFAKAAAARTGRQSC